MSDLDAIKSKPAAKRALKGVHMDWDSPEISFTTGSQGGAASGLNDAFLMKSAKVSESDLDDSQKGILEAIGEGFTALQKNAVEGNSSSSPSEASEEDNVNKHKEDNNTMSQEMSERIAQLEKSLAVSEAVNTLGSYKFEAEVTKAVAGAFADLGDEGKEAITKAFDALVARTEEAVTKAKEEASKEPAENELAKSLQEEAGKDGDAEVEQEVAKSLADRIKEHQGGK